MLSICICDLRGCFDSKSTYAQIEEYYVPCFIFTIFVLGAYFFEIIHMIIDVGMNGAYCKIALTARSRPWRSEKSRGLDRNRRDWQLVVVDDGVVPLLAIGWVTKIPPNGRISFFENIISPLSCSLVSNGRGRPCDRPFGNDDGIVYVKL